MALPAPRSRRTTMPSGDDLGDQDKSRQACVMYDIGVYERCTYTSLTLSLLGGAEHRAVRGKPRSSHLGFDQRVRSSGGSCHQAGGQRSGSRSAVEQSGLRSASTSSSQVALTVTRQYSAVLLDASPRWLYSVQVHVRGVVQEPSSRPRVMRRVVGRIAVRKVQWSRRPSASEPQTRQGSRDVRS
jgi:hypothetical protein